MSMRAQLTLVATLGVLALAPVANAADVPAPALPPAATAPQTIHPVKPDLFMVTGGGGNSTVRITPDGLIVVDSKNPGQQFYGDLMAQIRTVSPAPVKVLIDTHHHADHSGNNGLFLAAGAQVIAQKNLPGELDKFVPPANNPDLKAPAKPNVTYDTAYTVKLGGKTVRLSHYSPAHTSADTIVYFPDLKVVAMGDELNALAPNIDYAGGGSLAGFVNSLDQAMKLDWDRAIPGHGAEPWTKPQVKVFRDKLNTLLARARASVKAGTPKDRFIASLNSTELWPFPATFWNEARTNGLWAEAGGK
jgi:glyoxylase-like metal-dependent hydrolase (beta-lactamase superfamily II)